MHLTLHLTRSCNMRCRYCYAPPAAGSRMNAEVGSRALELGAKLTRGSCGIVFFGGEPLLERRRLEAIVAEARDREKRGLGRFHFKITTNGLLLDDAFLDFANREGILIAMSFDGVREAHDAHRLLPEGAGSFDRALERLQLLLAYKPYSSAIMVVNPDTAQHLSRSVELVLDLGLRYLIVALNYAGDWGEENLAALRWQYERLGRLYIKWTRAGRRFYLSPFEVKLSSHINRDCFDRERCDLGRRQISVDPEGFLYPCVQFPRAGPTSRWCVGSVFTGLDERRLDALNAESRQGDPQCDGCDLRSRCMRTCACLNWQAMGDIQRVSPVVCAHERMLTPIADRVGGILFRRREPMFIQKHYNPAYPALSLLADGLDVPSGGAAIESHPARS